MKLTNKILKATSKHTGLDMATLYFAARFGIMGIEWVKPTKKKKRS